MNSFKISPFYWSADLLAEQSNDVLHDLARTAVGSITSLRLLLGRCLVAGHARGLHKEHGCSGIIHYAAAVLGLPEWVAREARRVATRLEVLPVLRWAAENGEIEWSKLREVVRKADAMTERFWLELCKRRTYSEIEALVAATECGGLPSRGLLSDGSTVSSRSELRCALSLESMAIVTRGIQALSENHERRLSMEEALVLLFGQQLTESPQSITTLEAMKEDARKDVAADLERQQQKIVQAREMAADLGVIDASQVLEIPMVDETSEAARATSVFAPDGSGSSTEGKVAASCGCRPARGGMVGGVAESLPVCSPTCCEPTRKQSDDLSTDETVWLAANSAAVSICPTDETIRIAERDQPTWRNQKLAFNGEARKLTPAQRKEMLRRDGYCCSTPGCPNHLWLQAHHVVYFYHNGATVPGNIVILCSRCHKNLHNGELFITGSPEAGTLDFRDVRGRRIGEGTDLERALWLDTWHGWTGRSELDSRAFQALGPLVAPGEG